MHSHSAASWNEPVPDPASPRLNVVPVDEDLEFLLALWAAALEAEPRESSSPETDPISGFARDHDQGIRRLDRWDPLPADQIRSDEDQAASDLDQRASERDQVAADYDLAIGGDPVSHRRTSLARKQSTTQRDHVSALRAKASTATRRAMADRDRAADAAISHPGVRAGEDVSADLLKGLTLAASPDNLHLVYANNQADEFRRCVDVDPTGLFQFEDRLWRSSHTERRLSETDRDYLVCIEQATDEANPEGSPQPASPTGKD